MIKLSSALVATLSFVSLGANASTPDRSTCNVWQLACHWTAANREADYNINRVVIHKTEGSSASGASSWFANCGSAGSAQFVYDKGTGSCYQCVREHDIAWHAGYSSTNSNSVGIEHSGWTANDDTGTVCYQQSAGETGSCCYYYAVPNNRTYIIGHSEVPGCSGYGGGTSCHTDPGVYWNWGYYMGQVTLNNHPSLRPSSTTKVGEVHPAAAPTAVATAWTLLGTPGMSQPAPAAVASKSAYNVITEAIGSKS